MRITPLDIRHKEFPRAMRGYKDVSVDEFLDEITEEFEVLFNENIDYKDRLESLEEKIAQYQNIEDTLQKTLVSAQQQADELKQNAQKEADLILRDAELKSRSIINDSYAERQKIQRSVQALKQKYEDLRYQLRSTIEAYANILDQEVDAFEELTELEGTDSPAYQPQVAVPSAAASPVAESTSSDSVPQTAEGILSLEELAAKHQGKEGTVRLDPPENISADDSSEKTAVSIPPLKPAAGKEDKEEFFDDVEFETDEDKFKW